MRCAFARAIMLSLDGLFYVFMFFLSIIRRVYCNYVDDTKILNAVIFKYCPSKSSSILFLIVHFILFVRMYDKY